LYHDPERALSPLVDRIMSRVEERLGGELEIRRQQAIAQQILNESTPWMRDQFGRLTPLGQQYRAVVEALDAHGVKDPVFTHQIATSVLKANGAFQPQQVAPQSPTRIPNTMPAVSQPTNPSASAIAGARPNSLSDSLLQALRASGVSESDLT
jgi:hypothetical protein